MHRIDAYQMRRRTAEVGLNGKTWLPCVPSDRHPAYLQAAGTFENAQAMAAHGPRTGKLYDCTGDGNHTR
jgi:integrase/recombinase XerD